MERNGSPKPVFDSDDSSYVLVTLPAHPAAYIQTGNEVSYTENQLSFNSVEDIVAFCNQVGNQVSNQVSNQANDVITEQVHAKVKNILSVATTWISSEDIFNKIGLSNQSKNRKKYIDPLIDLAWIEMKYPENKTNPAQTYKITEIGKKVLNLISKQ
jgi:ATP-dependent DNA helicase RecG